MVIFTSDNGGERYSYNWPFSFRRCILHEGGTRVPAIVRWPGPFPRARHRAGGITMDWTATILAVSRRHAGSAYPLDGENLMPVCTGERGRYDRTLFWRTIDARRRARRQLEVPRGRDGEFLFDCRSIEGKGRPPKASADGSSRSSSSTSRGTRRMLPTPQDR
jgi:arylsulfatase A-like enzyme